MSGMSYFKSPITIPNFSIRLIQDGIEVQVTEEQQMFVYQLFTISDGQLTLNGELIIV